MRGGRRGRGPAGGRERELVLGAPPAPTSPSPASEEGALPALGNPSRAAGPLGGGIPSALGAPNGVSAQMLGSRPSLLPRAALGGWTRRRALGSQAPRGGWGELSLVGAATRPFFSRPGVWEDTEPPPDGLWPPGQCPLQNLVKVHGAGGIEG